MVYMGSKTEEHPDEILKQNHQMLAAVHRGRSAQYHEFNFSLCFFFFFGYSVLVSGSTFFIKVLVLCLIVVEQR